MKYRLHRDLEIQTDIWVRIEKIETRTSGYWFVPSHQSVITFNFDYYTERANAQSDKYEGGYEILFEFDSWEEAMLQIPWMFL